MIKHVVGLVIVIVVLAVGLSVYLQPDDLRGCVEGPTGVGKCQSADAIVAISGGDTEARVNEAIKLYKNDWAKVLVFSGAALDKSGPSNAQAMKSQAITAGVPESSIYIDEYANTTEQNAQNVQNILASHNIKSVILVTSGYHQRRADLEFYKCANGVKVYNHPVAEDRDWSFWWWTTVRGWWLAMTEAVKIIIFYITGIWS